MKGDNNFETEYYFNFLLPHTYIGTIKMPIGTNSWDFENYSKQLKRFLTPQSNMC